MDDVARLPAGDRADLFVVTGAGRGLTSEMIEKDFWVCWTLKRLFTLPDPPAGLLFKGATSLSKVFGVIERFSEDVDLSFDRAGLGFGGESEPVFRLRQQAAQRGADVVGDHADVRVTHRAVRRSPVPSVRLAQTVPGAVRAIIVQPKLAPQLRLL